MLFAKVTATKHFAKNTSSFKNGFRGISNPIHQICTGGQRFCY